MMFRRKPAETPEQEFTRTHPFGEAGTVDYWVEAMKRAAELGESRAQAEIDKLVALTGPQPPIDWLTFPDWFRRMWIDWLAPFNRGKDHPHAMPY